MYLLKSDHLPMTKLLLPISEAKSSGMLLYRLLLPHWQISSIQSFFFFKAANVFYRKNEPNKKRTGFYLPIIRNGGMEVSLPPVASDLKRVQRQTLFLVQLPLGPAWADHSDEFFRCRLRTCQIGLLLPAFCSWAKMTSSRCYKVERTVPIQSLLRSP